jgi:outer membrane protein TolC
MLDVPVPPLAAVREGVHDHPAVVQARQGVEAARVARDLLDPSYAARVQIEQAELRIDRAEEGLAEARRGLELQATQLHDAVQSALDRLAVERDALQDARERETQEAQRLDAGLIAEIAYEQARLGTAQAELAVAQAEHAVLRALFDLQAGAVTPIEGLDAF